MTNYRRGWPETIGGNKRGGNKVLCPPIPFWILTPSKLLLALSACDWAEVSPRGGGGNPFTGGWPFKVSLGSPLPRVESYLTAANKSISLALVA